MNDRPNPHSDMLFVEALACLPDDAWITFGNDLVSASCMACVRKEKHRVNVQGWLKLRDRVQLVGVPLADTYICAVCVWPRFKHWGD